jgi:hypothetical protein
VHGRTSQAIVAVAVRWEAVSGNRTTPLTISSYGIAVQPRFQLAPGQTGLFLPQGGLLLDASRLPAEFQLPPPPGGIPHSDQLQRFRQAGTIELTLDGVIFASGQFVGPNGAHEYERYIDETTVPPRIGAKVRSMKEAGQPIDAILAWLQATIAAPANPSPAGAWTPHAARSTASQLLGGYQTGGEDRLFTWAQRFAGLPVLQLYR